MRRPRRTSNAPAPLRPAELVGADRHEVGAQLVEGDRHVAGGGGGVDVHEHAGVVGSGHYLPHRLQRGDLVVAPLAVHQRRARGGTSPTVTAAQ